MVYHPIIKYTVNEHPYVQVDLGELPPKLQDELIDGISTIVMSYHTGHQRTVDWMHKADELNEKWKKKREISDLVNS